MDTQVTFLAGGDHLLCGQSCLRTWVGFLSLLLVSCPFSEFAVRKTKSIPPADLQSPPRSSRGRSSPACASLTPTRGAGAKTPGMGYGGLWHACLWWLVMLQGRCGTPGVCAWLWGHHNLTKLMGFLPSRDSPSERPDGNLPNSPKLTMVIRARKGTFTVACRLRMEA